jgi:hypothetical protein
MTGDQSLSRLALKPVAVSRRAGLFGGKCQPPS